MINMKLKKEKTHHIWMSEIEKASCLFRAAMKNWV